MLDFLFTITLLFLEIKNISYHLSVASEANLGWADLSPACMTIRRRR